MDKEKAQRLEAAGWKVGGASDFLGLSRTLGQATTAPHSLYQGGQVASVKITLRIQTCVPLPWGIVPGISACSTDGGASPD
jgi:hypothetical protein